MPTDASYPARRSWLLWILHPKLSIPVLLAAILIAAPFVYRVARIASVPEIGDPFDVEAFIAAHSPEGPNAFDDFLQAEVSLVPHPSGDTALQELQIVLRAGWDGVSHDTSSWHQANAEAIRRTREGTLREDGFSIPLRERDFLSASPFRTKLRLLAFLLILDAARAEHDDRLEDAVASGLALLRMSGHIIRHGSTLEHVIGLGYHRDAACSLMRTARDPEMSAVALRMLAAEVDRIEGDLPPISVAVSVDYLATMGFLSMWSQEPDAEGALERARHFLGGEPEYSTRLIRQGVAHQLRYCDLPAKDLPSFLAEGKLFDDAGATLPGGHLTGPEIEHRFFQASNGKLDTFLEDVARIVVRRAYGMADRDCLRTALALEIYRREQSGFPEELSELVPWGLLSEVPINPVDSAGGHLKYRRVSDGAVLWCKAPQGDNHAEEIIDSLLSRHSGRDAYGVRFYLESPPAEAELPQVIY